MNTVGRFNIELQSFGIPPDNLVARIPAAARSAEFVSPRRDVIRTQFRPHSPPYAVLAEERTCRRGYRCASPLNRRRDGCVKRAHPPVADGTLPSRGSL